MVSTQEIKEWVQHRVNYWEDELDKNDPDNTVEDIIESRLIRNGNQHLSKYNRGN